MLGNRHDAEDALQDTFLSVYRALGRYQERQTFRSWLFRVLINRCRSVARQRRRRDDRFRQDEGAFATAAGGSDEDGADLRDALQVELDAIEPLLREALLLKHGEGLEYREISALTGVGISALKMRVKRACALLRPRLRERLDG
jgi:RNA polymerase sigma-70 factor (ECF subfamily)